MTRTADASRRVHAVRAARMAIAVAAIALGVGTQTHALVIDAGDGLGTTEPPPDLPEWSNVGRRMGGPSVVYVGNQWILTAAHVGAGVVELVGERFDPVAGSPTPILNEDGSEADLLLFRIDRDPGLPQLPLSKRPPRVGEDVVLVGMGASRGRSVTIDLPGYGLVDGFAWNPDETKRWGTNLISGPVQPVRHGQSYTLAIPSIFDRIDHVLGTPVEATAAEGDSGGALFAHADALRPELGRVLSGVLFTVGTLSAQPPGTSLYGGITYAADVASYRDQMVAIIRPACSNERDDDGDGRIDHPDDPGCTSSDDDDELGNGIGPNAPTLWGALALGGLLAWRVVALWRSRG